MVAGKQQFNVWLPGELVKRVKHASVDANVSLSVFVERALDQHLEQLESEGEGEES
ncbi:ribbon-helix-helix domain-containing protein [Brevibacterium casei]|uniref:CopG family transcriptional regulator n=1 Tax=Brevibacterium casei TaxID=33889 RepID=A0A269Z5I8_9MICO|nr:CopG family transcriptional regulator [Brevibacterium casei]PAK93058.1 CopG family transcriptional regulator [Brevibacterium casei]QPR39511.1 CopG family transcriptional regulator [Brevibacterium casei]QPR43676.1 CopG family transcriptional regulator [Brevibacterium casei]